MAKEKTHNWQGVWDEGANGYVEYFGEPDGLPARDLTDEDLAGFNAEQKAKLKSETGQRLYHPVQKREPAKPKPKPKAATKPTAKPEPEPAATVDTGAASGSPVPDAGLQEGTAGSP